MLNDILNRFGYGSRRRRSYRPYAGGGLLSLAALLGWRNRDRIREFFRNRFGRGSQTPMAGSEPPLTPSY